MSLERARTKTDKDCVEQTVYKKWQIFQFFLEIRKPEKLIDRHDNQIERDASVN
jgi:hypothetical protein